MKNEELKQRKLLKQIKAQERHKRRSEEKAVKMEEEKIKQRAKALELKMFEEQQIVENILNDEKRKRNILDDGGFVVEDDILIKYTGTNQVIEIPPNIKIIKAGAFKHKIITCALIHNSVKIIEHNSMNKAVLIIANSDSHAIKYAELNNFNYLFLEDNLDYWLDLKVNDISWIRYRKMEQLAKKQIANKTGPYIIDKKNGIVFSASNTLTEKITNKNPEISTLAFDAYKFVIKTVTIPSRIKYILLHPKIQDISNKAFKKYDNVKLLVFKGTYGEQYAIDHGYEYEYYNIPK